MLKRLFKPVLKYAQELINTEYNKNGLTNEILEVQVKLNKIRNTLDIHDETEELFETFVQ